MLEHGDLSSNSRTYIKKKKKWAGVVRMCNPSAEEIETEDPWGLSQPCPLSFKAVRKPASKIKVNES